MSAKAHNKVYVFVMYNQKHAFTAGFVTQHKSCGNQAHDEVVFKWPGCGIFGTKLQNRYILTKSPKHSKNKYMSDNIMIQGTMSGVGKSAITAGLCRIFMQDGLHPAPFKSQNMALNSYITQDGLEMGRAQVMQAYAAGLEPQCEMNPILLKPTDDTGSQVIVNGRATGNMSAKEYFSYKTNLIPDIKKAYNTLASKYSPIIIEGAGSPAEINLKQNDIVNMGLAAITDAPVLLVGDIDRGGVFAQLIGTLELLTKEERCRVKGLIINKFRGDKSLLTPGIDELEKRTGIPVLGVIPYIHDINLEDEDSLSDRFTKSTGNTDIGTSKDKKSDLIKVTVIKLPHISNFTDFDPFEQNPGVSLHYASDADSLKDSDLILIPGSKNTIADLRFLKERKIDMALCKLNGHVPVIGICGGLQILGESISDPYNIESGGTEKGLGLLPLSTSIVQNKYQTQTEGTLDHKIQGVFKSLEGLHYSGYEIHAGISYADGSTPLPRFISSDSDIYATYIHGIFDEPQIINTILTALASRKGISLDTSCQLNERDFREKQYDTLAKIIRSNTDIDAIRALFDSSPSAHL